LNFYLIKVLNSSWKASGDIRSLGLVALVSILSILFAVLLAVLLVELLLEHVNFFEVTLIRLSLLWKLEYCLRGLAGLEACFLQLFDVMLLDRVLLNELRLLIGQLLCNFRAFTGVELLLKTGLEVACLDFGAGVRLDLLKHFCAHSFLGNLLFDHLILNFFLKGILEELGELSNGLVEQRQELVDVELEIDRELVDRFELETHADKESGLDVGQGH